MPDPDKRMKIPVGNGEAVFMGPAAKQECEIHDWPTTGLWKRLVKAMRDNHPTPGVNACRDCLVRAKSDAHA